MFHSSKVLIDNFKEVEFDGLQNYCKNLAPDPNQTRVHFGQGQDENAKMFSEKMKWNIVQTRK